MESVTARRIGVVALVCTVLFTLLGGSAIAAEKPKKTKKQKPPPIVDTFRYVPVPEVGNRQTIGDVTIEVESLIREGYQYPEIFAFTKADLDAAQQVWKQITGDPNSAIKNTFVYPTDNDGLKWVDILGHPGGEMSLAAFMVKVENNTDHILNFSKDAKVYFKDGTSDEPVAPLGSLDSMTQWLHGMEKDFDSDRKKGLLSIDFPFGITPSLFKVRFGGTGMSTFVDKDVLPGFSAKGVLLFPKTLGKSADTSNEIEVLFFEVPAATNEAGEITNRARATFRFRQIPLRLWFDAESKRWVQGDPPQPGDL